MAADWGRITAPRPPLAMGERTIRLDQPQVMGMINTTPDSFSDGGSYTDASAAAEAGAQMTANGAAIIDVGANPPGLVRLLCGKMTKSSAFCRLSIDLRPVVMPFRSTRANRQ